MWKILIWESQKREIKIRKRSRVQKFLTLFPYLCLLLSILRYDKEVQEGYSFPNKQDSCLSPHNSQELMQSKKSCRMNKVWTPNLAPSSWKELYFQVTISILNQKLWEKNLQECKRPADRKVVEEVTNPGKEAAYVKLSLKKREQSIDLIFARIKY